MTSKYLTANFDIEDSFYCCGVFDIGNLSISRLGLFNEGKPLSFNETASNFLESLLDSVADKTRQDGKYDSAGYLITASLNQHQEELRRFLEHVGFDPVTEFVNSNTLNKVTIFHLYIPYEQLEAYRKYKDYDDDDDF